MLRDKFRTPTKAPSVPNDHDAKLTYEELMLGVWRVLVVKDSPFSIINFRWESFSTTFAFFLQALYDVYTISPRLFVLCIVAHFWFAIEEPLSLYFSNRLFFFVGTVGCPKSVLTGVARSRKGFQEASLTIRHPLICTWQ